MPKPLKHWSVNALCEGTNSIVYSVHGRSIGLKAQAAWEELSPVQHLLIAMAGCFALSCRAVCIKGGLKPDRFEVVVTAQKAAGPENRLSNVVVSAIFPDGLGDAMVASVVAEAKLLCTVTNTVVGTPPIVYQGKTLSR
jgi:uncharacterized OsmC-like protein